MAAGAVVAVAPLSTEAASTSFKDLNSSNVHYNDIMNLVNRGVIKGYPDNTYKPGKAVTRAEAALILANVLELDTKNVTDPGFKDVPKTNFYYNAIAALTKEGIINGFQDGTFKPKDTLTRGQMAKIIQSAFELQAGNKETPFKDISNSFYKEYITALYDNKVTTGATPTTFAPAAPVTRGQLASFVVRGEEASKFETIVSVKDGKITTNKGTYEIKGDLAKVFNDANAAALKDAKVKFVTKSSPVASIAPVAADIEITGIDSLTLNAPNVTFNGGGSTIKNLTVNGNNTQVSNVTVTKLTLANSITVDLKGVTAQEVVTSKATKLTLDTASKITKLVIPAGANVKDIVTNFDAVKGSIASIVSRSEDGKETPVNPGTPSGGGGGGATPSATEVALDKAMAALTELYKTNASDYATVAFSGTNNEISITIKSDKYSTTISEFRTFLKDNSNGVDLVSLLKDANLTVAEALTILNAGNVTLKAGTHTDTEAILEYISDDFDVDRTKVVNTVDKFIDDAILVTDPSVDTLGEFKAKFSNNITITIGNVAYSVKVN